MATSKIVLDSYETHFNHILHIIMARKEKKKKKEPTAKSKQKLTLTKQWHNVTEIPNYHSGKRQSFKDALNSR